jgi:hypothetical protein
MGFGVIVFAGERLCSSLAWVWKYGPTCSSIQGCLVVICQFCRRADWSTLRFMSWQLCRAAWNVTCLSHHCCHCWNAPPTSALCSHPLFSFCKHSASIHECQQVQIFSAWRNSMTCLCSIHTYMSDDILPDCSLAAIYHICCCCWNPILLQSVCDIMLSCLFQDATVTTMLQVATLMLQCMSWQDKWVGVFVMAVCTTRWAGTVNSANHSSTKTLTEI